MNFYILQIATLLALFPLSTTAPLPVHGVGAPVTEIKLVKPISVPVPVPIEQMQEVPVAAPEPAPEPIRASGVVPGCGDNEYASFIYQHESGCNLSAQNAGGCLGIGQACPGSKLLAVCPDLSYACQNEFFTAYANAAYGGWAGAYQHWLQSSWW